MCTFHFLGTHLQLWLEIMLFEALMMDDDGWQLCVMPSFHVHSYVWWFYYAFYVLSGTSLPPSVFQVALMLVSAAALATLATASSRATVRIPIGNRNSGLSAVMEAE